MGRMVKNTVFSGAAYALGVPTGTSSIGPSNPANAQVRWNTTTSKLEFWANMTGTPSWNAIAREGNVTIARDNFTGNGVATQFWPLSTNFTSGDENKVLVHAGTVYQIPVTNYTFNGTGNIFFSSAPNNGAAITIISGFASTVSNIA
jgi:hypothetical protein